MKFLKSLGMALGVAMLAPVNADDATKKLEPLPWPFSQETKVISKVEFEGLSQLGMSGLTEYLVKPIPGIDQKKYRTFDASIVVSIRAGQVAPEMVQHIRGLVEQQVKSQGFEIADVSVSQAGIATILSPFRAVSGKTTWELLVVVFDRAKYHDAAQQKESQNGLDPIFKSAVRGVVAHLYPETDIDLKNGMRDEVTMDALRKLFDRAFSYFMQPLASEEAATNAKQPQSKAKKE